MGNEVDGSMGPRPSRAKLGRPAAVLALGIAVAGCATQAELRDQGRAYQGMIDEQSRSIEELKHAIAGLRAEVEGKGTGPHASSLPAPPVEQAPTLPPAVGEVTKLQKRVHELEQEKARSKEIGMTMSPESTSSAGTAAAAPTTATTLPAPPATGPPPTGENPRPPPQLAAVSPTPPPPQPAPIDEGWKREVAQDQAVASAMAVPGRSEYLGALDS